MSLISLNVKRHGSLGLWRAWWSLYSQKSTKRQRSLFVQCQVWSLYTHSKKESSKALKLTMLKTGTFRKWKVTLNSWYLLWFWGLLSTALKINLCSDNAKIYFSISSYIFWSFVWHVTDQILWLKPVLNTIYFMWWIEDKHYNVIHLMNLWHMGFYNC